MGLLHALIHTKVEAKSYYAGPVKQSKVFMRPTRNEGVREYEVVDRSTGKVIATYNQRGVAAQTTNRLNGEEQ